MTAPVRIDAEAWGDLRFATLARLCGLADLEHGLIRCAKIWSWQTEHYTPDHPTYVVDAEIIESVLGPSGPAALVKSRLAEEEPGGFRIKGCHGRIEWLWQRRCASKLGGEANKRRLANNRKPNGLAKGSAVTTAKVEPNLSPLSLSPSLSPEEITPSRAIPPSTEQAPSTNRRAVAVRIAIAKWTPFALEHSRIKADGIDQTAIGWGIASGKGFDLMVERIEELLAVGTEAEAEAKLDHVCRVRAAEARVRRRLDWFIAMRVFKRDNFEYAATLSVEQATRPARDGPEPAGDQSPSKPLYRDVK